MPKPRADLSAEYTGAMSRLLPVAALASCCLLNACHTANVNATITNNSGAPVRVVEMDYPSASFGTSTLAPGASFNYEFVIQGAGNLSLTYSDLQGRDHKSTGPVVDKGQEGSLLASIGTSSVRWTPQLSASGK